MKRDLTVAVVAACPFPQPRGTPVRIQRTAEALAARGHRIHVVTYHHGTGTLNGDLAVHRIPRVRTYHKVAPGPTYQKLLVLDPLLAMTLRKVLRRYPVDIIHAHHYEGLLVGAAVRRGTGIPLVYDAHTLLASELPYYGLGLPRAVKRFLGEQLDRRAARWPDHVISVTDTIRDRLVEGGVMADDRISVISNGVELELFDEGLETVGRPSTGVRTLIFTGNLAPYQRIDLLLEAFRQVLDQRQDVRLQIVTGSSFDPYEARARELGIRDSVELVDAGFDRIPSLLASSDIAVNPRVDCDGIPLKLLNYMAAARPVISFESSAPVVRHDQSGWLVRDGDVAGFARGVLRLLDDPEQAARLGRSARRYVETHHTWAQVADGIESVYRRLLGARALARG